MQSLPSCGNWLTNFARKESPLKTPQYEEGSKARQKFDEGMTKLFRVPKTAVTAEKLKPKPKREKASKD